MCGGQRCVDVRDAFGKRARIGSLFHEGTSSCKGRPAMLYGRRRPFFLENQQRASAAGLPLTRLLRAERAPAGSPGFRVKSFFLRLGSGAVAWRGRRQHRGQGRGRCRAKGERARRAPRTENESSGRPAPDARVIAAIICVVFLSTQNTVNPRCSYSLRNSITTPCGFQ